MKHLFVILFFILFSTITIAQESSGYNGFNFVEDDVYHSDIILKTEEQPSKSPTKNYFSKKANEIGEILNQGINLLGIKYKWGGINEITGFDCSSYVKEVFKRSINMTLPRTSLEMSKLGDKILSIKDLKPGDLVFFNINRRNFGHVGIYMGDSNFIHAKGTGDYVTINNLEGNYWKQRFIGARRLVNSPQE